MSLTDAWSVGSGQTPLSDCLVSSHKPPIPLQTSSETSLSDLKRLTSGKIRHLFKEVAFSNYVSF